MKTTQCKTENLKGVSNKCSFDLRQITANDIPFFEYRNHLNTKVYQLTFNNVSKYLLGL